MRISQTIGCVAILVFLLSACSVIPTPQAAAVVPTLLAVVTEQPQPTLQPPATEIPTVDPTQPPKISRVQFSTVSFAQDPAIFDGASGEVIPEKPLTTDGPYWDVNPEYVKISLSGYPLSETFFKPSVSVFPVDKFHALSPDNGQTLDKLIAFLSEKPSAADQIPFLPVMNAGQVFHSNMQYLDFQNGSGVRFLTLYAQYPAPINNYDLFYTFQGLTSDGRHMVSIILPVNHPSLPLKPEALPNSELEAMAQDPNYYPTTAAMLSSQPADSFTPSLSALDALVQSLLVGD